MYAYICLGHLYSFPDLNWSVLALRGRSTYLPRLVQILLQFQLRNILTLAFVEGVHPNMGHVWILGRSTKQLGSYERWAFTGGSFCWLSVLNTICLVCKPFSLLELRQLKQDLGSYADDPGKYIDTFQHITLAVDLTWKGIIVIFS